MNWEVVTLRGAPISWGRSNNQVETQRAYPTTHPTSPVPLRGPLHNHTARAGRTPAQIRISLFRITPVAGLIGSLFPGPMHD